MANENCAPRKGTMATKDFISSAGSGVLHHLKAKDDADFVPLTQLDYVLWVCLEICFTHQQMLMFAYVFLLSVKGF